MYRGKNAHKEEAVAVADDEHHHHHHPVKSSSSSSSLASLASDASRRLSSAGHAGRKTVRRVVARTLLSIEKVPSWYGENPHIRTGYRPVFAAAGPCFRSWAYLHNQSGNIYTHLVPGVAVATAGNATLAVYLARNYPGATVADRAVFHVYLTACAACFGLSAAYHTLLCHSRELADLWIRLDYVGISLLIMASFVPGLYMGFYCEPWLLRGYLGAVSRNGCMRETVKYRQELLTLM